MFSDELIEISGKHFIIDLMYAKPENMVRCAVYERIGFGNKAYVRPQLWEKLQKAVSFLDRHNFRLKIFDAYRPPIAHEMLRHLIPMDGFFAPACDRSLHCRGAAIDCCLCDEDGHEFIYPTKVDAYEKQYAEQITQGQFDAFFEHLKKARHDYDNPQMREEIRQRQILKDLMESIGLEPLAHEWWHYNLPEGKKLPVVEWQKG